MKLKKIFKIIRHPVHCKQIENKKKKLLLFKIGEILYAAGLVIGFGISMIVLVVDLILGLCPDIYFLIPVIVGLGLGLISVIIKFYAADGNIMIGMD